MIGAIFQLKESWLNLGTSWKTRHSGMLLAGIHAFWVSSQKPSVNSVIARELKRLWQSLNQIAESLPASRNDICFDRMYSMHGVIEMLQFWSVSSWFCRLWPLDQVRHSTRRNDVFLELCKMFSVVDNLTTCGEKNLHLQATALLWQCLPISEGLRWRMEMVIFRLCLR